MATFGKPDATGRSSGKRSHREAKHLRPPPGEPFMWHSREMLECPAWRGMGVNARRALDRIELEHMAHAGTENGKLPVTHEDFIAYGVSASEVRPAVDELEFLGLIRCIRGGRWNDTNVSSKYRLTWLGDGDGNAPSNEWKGVTQEQITAWKKQRRELRTARKTFRAKLKAATVSRGTVPRLSVVSGAHDDGAA